MPNQDPQQPTEAEAAVDSWNSRDVSPENLAALIERLENKLGAKAVAAELDSVELDLAA